MRNNLIKFFLVLVFLIGISIRLVDLSSVPIGFHVDEVTAGYEGRYILANGKDTYGHSYPLYFNIIGDYRPTGIFYLAGLSEAIFGMNEFAVRFPSALFGALTILGIYLLALKIFENKTIALLSSLFFAISLWDITLSRATSESTIATFLIVLGCGYLIHSINKSKISLIFLAAFLFFISLFFYPTARFLVPLISLYFLLVSFLKNVSKKMKLSVFLLFIFILISLFTIMYQEHGFGRVSQVAIWQTSGLHQLLVGLASGDGQNNILITRIYHNKIVFLARVFMEQYLSYFSPQYLFISGGLPLRYSTYLSGLFLITQVPFILIGFWWLIYKIRKDILSWQSLVLYLLIIAPIPAALTFQEVPNVQRSSFLIIPLTLICGFGFYKFLMNFINNKKRFVFAIFIVTIFIVFEFSYSIHQYFYHPITGSVFLRNDGEKELMSYIKDNKNSYNHIFIHRDAYILFYLFYNQDLKNNLLLPINNDPSITKIDNLDFVAYKGIKDHCVAKYAIEHSLFKANERIMFVDGGDCSWQYGNLKILKKIFRHDSTRAFTIYTLNN